MSILQVCHGGKQHLIRVRPGSAGRLAFHADVRRVCGLQPDDEMTLTFGCKAPSTGACTDQALISSYGRP